MNVFDKEQQQRYDGSDYGATDPVYPNFNFEHKEFHNIKDERTENLYEYFHVIFEEFAQIEGLYIAGGSLRNLLGGDDEIADIDVFFRDKKALDEAMEVMSRYEGSEDGCWYTAFRCPAKELITYKSAIESLMYGDATDEEYRTQKKVQFITKSFYPDPVSLISTFDFIPTCACLYKDTLYTHKDWVKHVKKRTLGYNFLSFPVASMYRLMKYRDKGYTVLTDTVLGMVVDINEGEFDDDRLALYID